MPVKSHLIPPLNEISKQIKPDERVFTMPQEPMIAPKPEECIELDETQTEEG